MCQACFHRPACWPCEWRTRRANCQSCFPLDLNRQPASSTATVEPDEDLVSKFCRLLAKVAVILVLTAFIMLKIAPEFLMILQEFGMETPAIFNLWVTVCDRVARYWFLGALLMLVLVPLGIPAFRQFLRRFNPLSWRQPALTRATSRRRTLAMLAQSGTSIAAAIPSVLATEPLRKMFRRLTRASEKMNEGENAWASLASQHILSEREAKSLAMTDDSQTQAWLLRWSADKRARGRSTRIAFFSRVFVGLVNVGIGLFVFLTAAAIFSTLITIMRSLG